MISQANEIQVIFYNHLNVGWNNSFFKSNDNTYMLNVNKIAKNDPIHSISKSFIVYVISNS